MTYVYVLAFLFIRDFGITTSFIYGLTILSIVYVYSFVNASESYSDSLPHSVRDAPVDLQPTTGVSSSWINKPLS
jgi:hypothetical protein